MKKLIFLLLLIALLATPFYLLKSKKTIKAQTHQTAPLSQVPKIILPQLISENPGPLKLLLSNTGTNLSPAVINKVITALSCAEAQHIAHTPILTVIDYSLPSNQKRLWIFDLQKSKLLYHTYVSHGLRTGGLKSEYFSNKNNSKASSIGVYKTDQAYFGREGLSLKLKGLDKSFNDNAYNRYIVMHGGWYVEEPFIKRYGRAGRSWGCPALPLASYRNIINTIKDEGFMVIYYPSEKWLNTSSFLTCHQTPSNTFEKEDNSKPFEPSLRDTVMFAGTYKKQKGKLEETTPILSVSANTYEQLFNSRPPLLRMLRRQIDNEEYIALSKKELDNLISTHKDLSQVHFVLPTLEKSHGYYETVMKIVNLGHIKSITHDMNKVFTVHFDGKPDLRLIETNRFIRWLGV